MNKPNGFWQAVHAFAEAYDGEGLTTHERLENVLAEFRDLPPLVRRELLADLEQIAVNLPSIHAQVHVLSLEVDTTQRRRDAAG